MAANSYWKGYLKLSLVTCPIRMVPATGDGEKVRFRTLNRATGHPVVSRSVDAVTGAVVPGEETVRGYPKGEDDYVLLEDEDLDAVAIDSTRTIDIETFIDPADVAWVWYDQPYYILPSDPVGEEAFAVIVAAMASTGRVGLSRLVMGGRERAVMLIPRLGGLVLWTLRYGDEVRDAAAFMAPTGEDRPDRPALDMLCRLIDARTTGWSVKMVTDPVQERLLSLIDAKRKKPHKPARKSAAPDTGGKVVSITDALRQSLSAERRR